MCFWSCFSEFIRRSHMETAASFTKQNPSESWISEQLKITSSLRFFSTKELYNADLWRPFLPAFPLFHGSVASHGRQGEVFSRCSLVAAFPSLSHISIHAPCAPLQPPFLNNSLSSVLGNSITRTGLISQNWQRIDQIRKKDNQRATQKRQVRERKSRLMKSWVVFAFKLCLEKLCGQIVHAWRQ